MSEDKKKRGNSFGDNLKEQRSKKYKTQKEFADILGIPATTYGQYETGRREPDFTMLLKIAELLEVSVDYLMKGIGTDSYIYLVRDGIKKCLHEMDILKDKTDEGKGWEIIHPYGNIVISMDDYEKIINSTKEKFETLLDENIKQEIDKRRLSMYKVNDFSKVEGRMLCDSLGYDYSTIKGIALKAAYDSTKLYEWIVIVIYYMYFTNFKIEPGEKNLYSKFDWYKTVINSDVFHFDFSRNLTSFYSSKKAHQIMYQGWPGDRELFMELDAYCPEHINPLVKEFLRQHWELSEEEMNMPFRKMRYIFFRYGLVKFEGNIDREAEAKDFLFWRGSRKD